MKSNINVESSESDDLFPNPESSASSPHQSPSEMTASASESDVDHTTEKTSRTAKDLRNNKVTSSSSLSPVYRPPPSPIMEIIPPPLSHRLRVTTSQESVTSVISESSDTNLTFTPELTEIPHTPLTESQIDDAKSLVLDLLGWGVDPEYLVTSGVHPQLIYRIFADLNLRLPTNLVLFDDDQLGISTSIPDL